MNPNIKSISEKTKTYGTENHFYQDATLCAVHQGVGMCKLKVLHDLRKEGPLQ